jgi:hypothetical protein
MNAILSHFEPYYRQLEMILAMNWQALETKGKF